jgi:Ca2+/Na+ antiporter
MGVALEIVIIPVLLITAVVLVTLLSDLHVAAVLAGGVFLGILYFVVVMLLKEEREQDVESDMRDEEEAPAAREREADAASHDQRLPGA